MKYILLLPLILLNFQIAAQDNNLSSEIYPEFEQCVNIEYANQAQCFNQTLINHIISNFEVPEIVQTESYKGQLTIIFEVDEEGEFQLIYIDAAYDELKEETRRVFNLLPNVKPATYNGRPIHMQFKMPLRIPLQENVAVEPVETENEIEVREETGEFISSSDVLSEYEEIKSDKFTNP